METPLVPCTGQPAPDNREHWPCADCKRLAPLGVVPVMPIAPAIQIADGMAFCGNKVE
jgi:hypothetical protein